MAWRSCCFWAAPAFIPSLLLSPCQSLVCWPDLSSQQINGSLLCCLCDLLSLTIWNRYAIAKISGLLLVQAMRKQYGFKGISVMPTNLYGPGEKLYLAWCSHSTRSNALFCSKGTIMIYRTRTCSLPFFERFFFNQKKIYFLLFSDNHHRRMRPINGVTTDLPCGALEKWCASFCTSTIWLMRASFWCLRMIVTKLSISELEKMSLFTSLLRYGAENEHLVSSKIGQMVCKTVGFKGTLEFDAR